MATDWIAENIVEIFGAVTGIAYVILEIRRNILLWPLGIITSAVYIYVFGREAFYANMSLQVYYLVISIYGWYVWRVSKSGKSPEAHRIAESFNDPEARRASSIVKPDAHQSSLSPEIREARRASGIVEPDAPQSTLPVENIVGVPKEGITDVLRIKRTTAVWCALAVAVLWGLLWFVLARATDSPVPLWDGLIASLSVVATWMLTRKYIEQWYVWIIANAIAIAVYLASGLYPTAILFFVYFVMAIIGVIKWRRDARPN